MVTATNPVQSSHMEAGGPMCNHEGAHKLDTTEHDRKLVFAPGSAIPVSDSPNARHVRLADGCEHEVVAVGEQPTIYIDGKQVSP